MPLLNYQLAANVSQGTSFVSTLPLWKVHLIDTACMLRHAQHHNLKACLSNIAV